MHFDERVRVGEKKYYENSKKKNKTKRARVLNRVWIMMNVYVSEKKYYENSKNKTKQNASASASSSYVV